MPVVVAVSGGAHGLLEGNASKGIRRDCSFGRRWKCNLVLQFVNALIAPPIGFELLILCNCIPVRNSMLALTLRAFLFWSLGSDLCDLTLN